MTINKTKTSMTFENRHSSRTFQTLKGGLLLAYYANELAQSIKAQTPLTTRQGPVGLTRLSATLFSCNVCFSMLEILKSGIKYFAILKSSLLFRVRFFRSRSQLMENTFWVLGKTELFMFGTFHQASE